MALALALCSCILSCNSISYQPLQRTTSAISLAIAASLSSCTPLQPLLSFPILLSVLCSVFLISIRQTDYCFRQYTEPPQSWTSSSPVFHTYSTPDKSMLPQSASALLTRNTFYSTPRLVPSSCTTTAPLAALFASFQPSPTNTRKRTNLDTPLLGFTFSTLLLRWWTRHLHTPSLLPLQDSALYNQIITSEEITTSDFGLDPG